MVTTVSDAQAEEAIRAIGKAVGESLDAQCVLLFGSRARGDHKAHSDVDLAVIMVASYAILAPQERIDLENAGSSRRGDSKWPPVPQGRRQGLDRIRIQVGKAFHQSCGRPFLAGGQTAVRFPRNPARGGGSGGTAARTGTDRDGPRATGDDGHPAKPGTLERRISGFTPRGLRN